MRYVLTTLCAGVLATALVACSKKREKTELAPATSALSSAVPATETTKTFALDRATSQVEFMMDAELEKIAGRAPASAEGEIFVDLSDLGKSTGLIKVDLDKLSIYKRVRDDAEAEFGSEEKSEKQNRDMRNWFQIGEDAPTDDREKFRWAEFKITSVKATPNNVAALKGESRQVKATILGDFRLHGRTTQKTIDAELSFSFAGDSPTQLQVKTTKPFEVGLEEHDVKPRKSFAQLADATLDVLGKKVAKVARVSLELGASPK